MSQILSQTPAGLQPEGGLRVHASQASTLGATSFQNQAVTGVLSLTGGDAGGLAVSATVGSLSLSAGGDVVVAGDNVGAATIPNGVNDVAIANTNITANSLILVTPLANNDAIAAGQGPLRVVLTPNVGFSIFATTNANGALRVAYWILKY